MKSIVLTLLLSFGTNGVDSFNLVVPSTFVSSFKPTSHATALSAVVIGTSTTSTGSTTGSTTSSHPINDDVNTYQYVLNQARQYAYSDTTTTQQAQQYLRYILELQSDCVAGTVIGKNICGDDNIIELVDIVAHLRQKVKNHSQQVIITSPKEIVAFTSIISMIVALSVIIHSLPTISNSDTIVVPFELEEWRWAIRDGYLNTMIAHYLRHGGL